MRAAAEARPWRKRRPEVFWSGGDTNDQRKIMVESDQVRQSNLTDIRMMSWGDGPAAFRENFRSLAEHCDYRWVELGRNCSAGSLRGCHPCKYERVLVPVLSS